MGVFGKGQYLTQYPIKAGYSNKLNFVPDFKKRERLHVLWIQGKMTCETKIEHAGTKWNG